MFVTNYQQSYFTVDVMFKAMLDCQALNPDPNEPEDDGKFFRNLTIHKNLMVELP